MFTFAPCHAKDDSVERLATAMILSHFLRSDLQNGEIGVDYRSFLISPNLTIEENRNVSASKFEDQGRRFREAQCPEALRED